MVLPVQVTAALLTGEVGAQAAMAASTRPSRTSAATTTVATSIEPARRVLLSRAHPKTHAIASPPHASAPGADIDTARNWIDGASLTRKHDISAMGSTRSPLTFQPHRSGLP